MDYLPNWHLEHETRVLSKTSQSSETSLHRETTLMNNDDDRAVAASCVVFELKKQALWRMQRERERKVGQKLEDTSVMGGGRERKRPFFMVRP